MRFDRRSLLVGAGCAVGVGLLGRLADQAGAIETAARSQFVPSTYTLVFADEFDDPDIARINENGIGGRPGAPAWRSRYRQPRKDVINKEKQIYVDPAFAGTSNHPLGVQPFSIAASVLRIRADRADPIGVSPYIWGYKYTSGCITSEFTHSQKYGYFEMRARLPAGKGFWPAFWLLPRRVAWPPEIDVFEGFGTRKNSVHQGVIEAPHAAQTGWVRGTFDVTDGFHVYGLEWSESSFAFFVDGRQTNEFTNHAIHEEMYILANLALGSHDQNWVPDPDQTTPFPGYFEIDYIRAYARP
jgi:beta-glucanase (GH16 family)